MGRDVMKLIKETRGHNIINRHYDMKVNEANTLRMESKNMFDMICNAFVFGYVQGMKAQKAEIKRGKGK